MAKYGMVVLGAIIWCMMLVIVMDQAESSITCETVVNSLMPCRTYLQNGGAVSAQCCSGVSSLNSAANNPADRKTACQCLKTAAKSVNANPQYAASLPSKCNVNVGYPISYSTNCDTIN